MQRYLYKELKKYVGKKILLLSGPRQVGKTTLSKALFENYDYFNFDRLSDRKKLIAEEWNRETDLIIFDEIHKMKKWKQWLKGIYDTELKKNFLVTGSARLDTHRKVGDSMAGRYFQYRLMPFCLKELAQNKYQTPKDNLNDLLKLSGFPEPLFSNSESFYKKWRKSHLDIIVRQDIAEIEAVKRITDLEFLIELMKSKVGSILSYNSLREDLLTDDKTIKRWLTIFENSYLLFKITPFSKSILHSTKKAPKFYFYDFPRIEDNGARLENLVALSLLKEIYFLNDTEGEDFNLHFLRDKDQNEVDFLITKNKKPIMAIEVKTSDVEISPGFKKLTNQILVQFPELKRIQLVKNLEREFSNKEGIKVLNLEKYLSTLKFA
ncbi:MAG: ATP-binding protein [Bacteriovorax sp.]|nr:ATP-binding protein [Bacteriovorax sp.]